MPRRRHIYTPHRGSGAARHVRNAAVERIYRDDNGNLPDFSRLDRRPPSWRRWAIGGGLITLAILAVAAWGSFLVFKPYTASSGGNVVVTIDAPSTTALGEELTYRITMTNDDRIPLATAELEVRLPEDFAVTTAEPAPDDARGFRWTIGTIPSKERRTFDIRGRLYGPPDTAKRIEAIAVYRPANFNADFQSIADATTTLGASPVALTLTGPDHTVPNAPVTYTIAYEYTGTLTTPATIVTLEVPRAFVFASAKPERARGDALAWRIGALEPNTKGTISVIGSFNAGQQEPFTVRATVAIEPAPDRRVALQTSDVRTPVLGGDVVLIATVNDQTTGFATAPGDALRLRIAVRNDGKEELQHVRVHAILEATSIAERSILNFSSITDATNGIAVGEQLAPGLRRGTITWTEKEIPELAALTAGSQRQIDIVIPIHTAASLPGFPAQGRVSFTTAVDIAKTGTVEEPRRVTTTPIELTVTAN